MATRWARGAAHTRRPYRRAPARRERRPLLIPYYSVFSNPCRAAQRRAHGAGAQGIGSKLPRRDVMAHMLAAALALAAMWRPRGLLSCSASAAELAHVPVSRKERGGFLRLEQCKHNPSTSSCNATTGAPGAALPVREMAASATADAGAGLRSEFPQVLLSRRRDLQGGDVVNGSTGTAGMAPQQLQGNNNVQAVVDLVRDAAGFLFAHQRHIWVADINMQDLQTALRRLHENLKSCRSTMLHARGLGWLLSTPAEGWVCDGYEIMKYAGEVLHRFKETRPDSAGGITAVANFPCYFLSRRVLNSKAVMYLNRIEKHIACGKSNGYTSRSFEAMVFDTTKYNIPHSSPIDEVNLPDFFLGEPIIATIYSEDASPAEMSSGLTRQQVVSASTGRWPPAMTHDKVRLSTIAQALAVLASESPKKFPVLVRVEAPVYMEQTRAPIDLVMAMDISGTMRSVLQQLKQGAVFAILNLSQDDRLAIVPFGPRLDEPPRLTQMSEEGKRNAIAVVQSLETSGGAGVVSGLKRAYEVLQQRSETHRVGAIILLTDGIDTPILKESRKNITRKSFEESDRDIAVRRRFPTYTFGFGSNQDPRTLYYLACQGYGTYSFADGSQKNIEDAMALCIGGLTSIVARDVVVTIESAHPEVKISEIRRGLHDGGLSNDHLAKIHVKDLFGDEEKNLLVYVDIPKEEGRSGSMAQVTKLLNVTAEYRSPVTSTKVRIEAEVCVERPRKIRSHGSISNPPSPPQVETEICRVKAVDHVRSIWNKIAVVALGTTYYYEGRLRRCDVGNVDRDWVMEQLNDLLRDLNPDVKPSADPEMASLRSRLYNDVSKMVTGISQEGVVTGLPYMLSWLSSQLWQRAASQVVANDSSFLTVNMHNMIASVETALAQEGRRGRPV